MSAATIVRTVSRAYSRREQVLLARRRSRCGTCPRGRPRRTPAGRRRDWSNTALKPGGSGLRADLRRAVAATRRRRGPASDTDPPARAAPARAPYSTRVIAAARSRLCASASSTSLSSVGSPNAVHQCSSCRSPAVAAGRSSSGGGGGVLAQPATNAASAIAQKRFTHDRLLSGMRRMARRHAACAWRPRARARPRRTARRCFAARAGGAR